MISQPLPYSIQSPFILDKEPMNDLINLSQHGPHFAKLAILPKSYQSLE